MLVCFTLGGTPEFCFETGYHDLSRVTICFVTYVTIFLKEFRTIFNALPILAYNQMCYCMPYHTLFVKNVRICTILNALLYVPTKSFKKEYIYPFKNNVDNALKILQLCTCFTVWEEIQ